MIFSCSSCFFRVFNIFFFKNRENYWKIHLFAWGFRTGAEKTQELRGLFIRKFCYFHAFCSIFLT